MRLSVVEVSFRAEEKHSVFRKAPLGKVPVRKVSIGNCPWGCFCLTVTYIVLMVSLFRGLFYLLTVRGTPTNCSFRGPNPLLKTLASASKVWNGGVQHFILSKLRNTTDENRSLCCFALDIFIFFSLQFILCAYFFFVPFSFSFFIPLLIPFLFLYLLSKRQKKNKLILL